MLTNYLLYAQYYFMSLAFLMFVLGTWRRDIILFIVLFLDGLTHTMLFSGATEIYSNLHILFYTVLFLFAVLRDLSYRIKKEKEKKRKIKISSITKE